MVLYSSGSARERSASRVSARSMATSLTVLFSVGIPKALAVAITLFPPRIGTSSFPWAAHLRLRTTSRACMPCWAAPAAPERSRLRLTMRSASAPQTPRDALGVIRQGPILQILQQIPASPKLHCGFCLSKRSKAVSKPICSALKIISLTAGSGVLSITSCFDGNVFLYSLTALV